MGNGEWGIKRGGPPIPGAAPAVFPLTPYPPSRFPTASPPAFPPGAVCREDRRRPGHPGCSPRVDPEREILRGQLAPDRVLGQVGQVPDPIDQAKHIQRGCVRAHADARVAGFESPQGRWRDLDPIGHDRSLNTPAAARIPDIGSELAEGPANGQRHWWCGSWHSCCPRVLVVKAQVI